MTEIIFQLDDRMVNIELLQEGGAIAQETVEASPQVVTNLLQAIQEMVAANQARVTDITKVVVEGELRGSSANRVVHTVATMLELGAS